MPYKLDESGKCVVKKDTGEKVKCHPTHAEAVAHLAALRINVEDAGKWLSVSQEYVPSLKAVTDAPDLRGSSERHCGNCNFYKMMPYSGYELEDQRGICEKHAFVTDYGWVCNSWKTFLLEEAMKVYFGGRIGIKVLGDWELLVNGNPFGPDGDGQWFDSKSKIVTGSDIPVVYYHSLKEFEAGNPDVQFNESPIVIGKASNPEVKPDGVWWKVVLDKGVKEAKKVWEAAEKRMAVASSGAIDYLSRLDIGGKLVPYEKTKPGRIAIWHMGELSLWERDSNHLPQSHPHAIAVPALKAIYEAAGMALPPSIVSPKNAETPGKVRKGELEELHTFTNEIERFIENMD